MKKIVVLGATGSIGKSTLDIARNMPDDFKIVGITANKNKSLLEKLSKEFNCKCSLTSVDQNDGIKKLIAENKIKYIFSNNTESNRNCPSCRRSRPRHWRPAPHRPAR